MRWRPGAWLAPSTVVAIHLSICDRLLKGLDKASSQQPTPPADSLWRSMCRRAIEGQRHAKGGTRTDPGELPPCRRRKGLSAPPASGTARHSRSCTGPTRLPHRGGNRLPIEQHPHPGRISPVCRRTRARRGPHADPYCSAAQTVLVTEAVEPCTCSEEVPELECPGDPCRIWTRMPR